MKILKRVKYNFITIMPLKAALLVAIGAFLFTPLEIKVTDTKGAKFLTGFSTDYKDLAWARPQGSLGQTKGATVSTAVGMVVPLSPSQRFDSLRPRAAEERAMGELVIQLREILSGVLGQQVVARIPQEALIQLALTALEDASDQDCINAIGAQLHDFGVSREDAPRIFSSLRQATTEGRITPFFVAAGMPDGYEKIWPRDREDTWTGEGAREAIRMAIRNVFTQIFIHFHISPNPQRTVVDIGARTGWLERLLGRQWADNMILFDKNRLYLRRAEAQRAGRAYVSGDVYELTRHFSNIDMILSLETFDTFLNLPQAALQCRNALAPGGLIIIVQASPVQIEPLMQELAEKGIVYSPYCVEFFDSEEKRRHVEDLYKQVQSLPEDAPEDLRRDTFGRFLDAKESLSFNTGEYFQHKLTAALQQAGFEILLSQGVKGAYVGPKEDRHRKVSPSSNIFSFLGKMGHIGYDYSIPLGYVVEVIGARVVVARKARIAEQPIPSIAEQKALQTDILRPRAVRDRVPFDQESFGDHRYVSPISAVDVVRHLDNTQVAFKKRYSGTDPVVEVIFALLPSPQDDNCAYFTAAYLGEVLEHNDLYVLHPSGVITGIHCVRGDLKGPVHGKIDESYIILKAPSFHSVKYENARGITKANRNNAPKFALNDLILTARLLTKGGIAREMRLIVADIPELRKFFGEEVAHIRLHEINSLGALADLQLIEISGATAPQGDLNDPSAVMRQQREAASFVLRPTAAIDRVGQGWTGPKKVVDLALQGPIEIIPMTKENIRQFGGQIVDIEKDSTFEREGLWSIERFLEDNRASTGTALEGKWEFSFLVMYNGRPVGYVIGIYGNSDYPFSEGNMFAFRFAVHRDFRAKGIGTALLHRLAKAAIDRGIGNISLETWTENTDAQRLYERVGFARVGSHFDERKQMEFLEYTGSAQEVYNSTFPLEVVDVAEIDDRDMEIGPILAAVRRINERVGGIFRTRNNFISDFAVLNSYYQDPHYGDPHYKLRTFVAMVDGEAVGYIVYDYLGGKSSIEYMAVDPDFQRSGTGTSLLKRVFKFTLEQRKNSVTVYTGTRNTAARDFYRTRGGALARDCLEWNEEGDPNNVKFLFCLTRWAAITQRAKLMLHKGMAHAAGRPAEIIREPRLAERYI